MENELIKAVLKDATEKAVPSLVDLAISCFTKDPVEFTKSFSELYKKVVSIPDVIFWQNFTLFIQEASFNETTLYKLSERLEATGNKIENASAIVYAINKIDDGRKAKYMSWLTISLINQEIDLVKYFRLLKTIENMTYFDLVYLADNIENIYIKENDEMVDEFLANGLIYNAEAGFSFSTKAIDLVKYSLRRGHSMKTFSNMPKRLLIKEMEEMGPDDIKKAWNEVFYQDN